MRSNTQPAPARAATGIAAPFTRPTTIPCQFLHSEAPGNFAPSTTYLQETFVIGYLNELDIPITLRENVAKVFEAFADSETPYDSLVAENIHDHILVLGENGQQPDEATTDFLNTLAAEAKTKGIQEIQLRRIPRNQRRQ